MKTLKYLSIVIFFIPLMAFAQKKLTIEDASGMNRDLYPSSLRNLQWAGSDSKFSWIDKNALVSRSINSTVTDTLITLNALNSSLKNAGIDTLNRMPPINWLDDDAFTINIKNIIYRYNLKHSNVKKLNDYQRRQITLIHRL